MPTRDLTIEERLKQSRGVINWLMSLEFMCHNCFKWVGLNEMVDVRDSVQLSKSCPKCNVVMARGVYK